MMPGMDGVEVLKRIRKESNVPVIMLTAKSDTFDKVLVLELGADDYIVKPFDPKELTARIKAVVRRSEASAEEADDTIRFPDLEISITTYTVVYKGEKLELPPKELELLYFLASAARIRCLPRERLLQKVWELRISTAIPVTVDVHVKRLREKLVGDHPWQIKTVWGVGYKFEVK